MASTLANLVVKITGNTSELNKALDSSESRSNKFAKNAGGSIQEFGKIAGAALVGAGVAIAGLGTIAGKMAIDFERSFAQVKTLVPDLNETGITELREGVLELSKEFAIAAGESVPALYQAISAGIPADNVLSFMETAAKAAVGGATDLETAVDGLSSVINAYGDSALSAQATADIMFTGVRLGKTTFEELSASMFNVVPTAASLGVGIDEVTAALAVMTAQGVPTSVATTQLRQAFVEASKDGSALDKALRNLTGQGFTGLIREGKGAAEIFEGLRSSMPDDEFRNLFGSVEAMNAALQITGPNADAMTAALDEMRNSAGAVDGAFGTMAETTGFKLDKALGEIKILLINLGDQLLPVIASVLSDTVIPALEAFGDWFNDHRDEIRAVIEVVAGAIGDLASDFASGFGAIMPLLKGVRLVHPRQ
jgi:TP901 family phage tail tape measure protein